MYLHEVYNVRLVLDNLMRTLLRISTLLWMLAATSLVLAADPTNIIEDAGRRGDVVALALSTAIAAIGFSAWLVRQMLIQNKDTTTSITELAVRIGELADELKSRPCYKDKDR